MMIEQIILIGYRATGKSTIGVLLARKLGWEFIDTDQSVCQTTGMSIEEIVIQDGWTTFRQYEAQALKRASAREKCVIATGGGAVLHKDVWEQIQPGALVVWLSAAPQILVKRLAANKESVSSRPSLTGGAIDREIARVLSERIDLYRQYSDLEIDTGSCDVDQAVGMITAAWHDVCQEGK